MDQLRLEQFLPYRLSVASNAVSNHIAVAYRKRFGLKVAEWRVVAILAEHDLLTPNRIGELTRMDKITVSRAATALSARGFVVTQANPDDGRSHFLRLTDAGQELYGQITPEVLRREKALFSEFQELELQHLDQLLRRVEAAAQASTHSERL